MKDRDGRPHQRPNRVGRPPGSAPDSGALSIVDLSFDRATVTFRLKQNRPTMLQWLKERRTMAISLKAGTVVRLKSGSPAMTVVGEQSSMGVLAGKVQCEWFDEKNKPQHGAFSETSLEEIQAGSRVGIGTVTRG